MRYETDISIIKTEDFFREQFKSDNFPLNYFTAEINTVSIDFVREASKYIDIKKVLWNARPWNVEETIEDHMNYWHKHLKEFWKDMLTDEEFNGFYKPPIPVNVKSIKQMLGI